MTTVLLRPNRRILAAAMAMPGLGLVIGLALAFFSDATWLRVIGAVIIAFLGIMLLVLAWQMLQPRLAYRNGRLLVYLQFGSPIRAPIEVVECAFLGAGPLQLPGRKETVKASNLIIRLAEKEKDWAERPVLPSLGRWTDGYITLYGAWCERLDIERVQQLNQRLHELKAEWTTRSAGHAT